MKLGAAPPSCTTGTRFLAALQKVDPGMAVAIEHEDQELDPIEGLRTAARTLLDAARGI
ncbi:hypothetical protein [Geodermatophilus ruber]|uniref:AP endonuclease family 2 C terminus n=1 Tax=Geodermatophilus ruber TaxID=504800 RepID=A0A1I3Z2D4_9ACTN|nr:hypothetical protein [Geodermatophilus ruber]SFK38147.1 AP endonuclease family 2 C terminus [Geodermatophilus ruber]